MPSPAAAPSFCATCGWPLADKPRCDACGGDAVPLPLRDAGRFVPRAAEQDGGPAAAAALDKAIEAWERGDHARAVSHVIGALGASSRAVSGREGPAWILSDGRVALFLTFAAEVTIEAPLAMLPQRQRVPALRFALEAPALDLAAARICLRRDRLVYRFVARVASLSPAVLLAALRASFRDAGRFAAELASAFDAPAIEGDVESIGWDAVGASRSLAPLALPTRARSVPPPKIPSLRPPAPLSSAAQDDDDDASIPAILAPTLAGGARRMTPPIGSGPVVPDLAPRRQTTLHEINVDTPHAVARPAATPVRSFTPAARSMTPSPRSDAADRLCELLRHAQTLATALSFHEKPASMMLLVRATVYRALFEFGDSVPAATAHLYAATAATTREIWVSPSGDPRRRSSMSVAIPLADPALLVMEQIVAARAVVPKGKSAVIEPLTSADQAKQHLARWIAEIERSPEEVPLRHFLCLGALAELLTRTKLPPTTHTRLKDIVAHALREGAVPASVELMTTAVRRIIG